VADFALLGVDAGQAQRAASACRWAQDITEEGDYELWPEHQDAWEVFLDCKGQWRVVAGMGGVWFQALESASVESSLRVLGVPRKRWREVREQVRVLEDEALEHLNRRD